MCGTIDFEQAYVSRELVSSRIADALDACTCADSTMCTGIQSNNAWEGDLVRFDGPKTNPVHALHGVYLYDHTTNYKFFFGNRSHAEVPIPTQLIVGPAEQISKIQEISLKNVCS